MELMSFLKQVPLFSGLTSEQFDELAMIVTIQDYARGQSIFVEGDPGTGFYVVMDGLVKIYKLSYEGKEQILHIFGEGEPFAEAAIFANSNFPACSMALKKSRTLFVPRRAFMELIEKNPALAMNMLAAMSLRLKKFANLIEDLSLKEVPGRVAAHLLYLSGQQGESDTVHLSIGKAQLSSLLGTIPETLSRILGRMSKQGLISSEGPRITILNRQGLEDLAMGEKL